MVVYSSCTVYTMNPYTNTKISTYTSLSSSLAITLQNEHGNRLSLCVIIGSIKYTHIPPPYPLDIPLNKHSYWTERYTWCILFSPRDM